MWGSMKTIVLSNSCPSPSPNPIMPVNPTLTLCKRTHSQVLFLKRRQDGLECVQAGGGYIAQALSIRACGANKCLR